ncbi:MAG: hypothetical protein ACLFU6_14085, partial [Candidatus Hydrogenedentota bacterium]
MTSIGTAAVLAVALAPGVIPAEPWTSADEQLNLFEIWNERYGTDYVSNLELEEYRLEDAQLFAVGQRGGSVEAVARFHESDHAFGYYKQTNGEIEQEFLFDVTDWGMIEGDEYRETLPLEFSIGFYAKPGNFPHTWFSEPALQAEPHTGQPQLAVYEAPEFGKLLLAWEANPVEDSNKDFNDLVVELDQGPGGMILFGRGGLGGLMFAGLGIHALELVTSSSGAGGGLLGLPVESNLIEPPWPGFPPNLDFGPPKSPSLPPDRPDRPLEVIP